MALVVARLSNSTTWVVREPEGRMISNSAGFIVGLLLFFDVLDEEVVALGEGVTDVDLLLAGEVLEEDGLFAFGEGVASEVVVEGDFYFHCWVVCLGWLKVAEGLLWVGVEGVEDVVEGVDGGVVGAVGGEGDLDDGGEFLDSLFLGYDELVLCEGDGAVVGVAGVGVAAGGEGEGDGE